jgi:hypothetical protein
MKISNFNRTEKKKLLTLITPYVRVHDPRIPLQKTKVKKAFVGILMFTV